MGLKIISKDEAASYINNGDILGFSGFTPAGAAKAIPGALAARARKEHQAGKPFKVGIITGASTGDALDGELARARAVLFRTPYQSNKALRELINNGEVDFFDIHLSSVAQSIRYGFFGKINFAIIEAADVTEKGEITLTSSVGISPTICASAQNVLIELNKSHPAALRGIHDIYEPEDPPHRKEIPVFAPEDRAGSPVITIDPDKILGIVETDIPDETSPFKESDDKTETIGSNVASFLLSEMERGTIPAGFLPVQSGVGNIANAVLSSLGGTVPQFRMYTEVIQDSVITLMKNNAVSFASGCSLTVSKPVLKNIYGNLPFFKKRILLRPQEISNNPEIIRRLGLITINTALEADLFGNINSTNVLGSRMMNGIGGSGDFTRNAYLSIFTCPSTAKNGTISTIVPMVTHADHSEHSVQVLITEQGIADLRAKSPKGKMEEILNNCVHPDYREQLREYARLGGHTHTPQTLCAAFGMHQHYLKTGTMKGIDWGTYICR